MCEGLMCRRVGAISVDGTAGLCYHRHPHCVIVSAERATCCDGGGNLSGS